MVYLDLTHETGGNANGAGMADVVTARLESKVHRPSTYMNALTSTTPAPVKLPMVMPTDRLAVAAALQMLEGVSPGDARIARIKNTLKLRRMHVSEALLPEVERHERLRVVEDPRPMRFGEDGSLI